MKRRAKRSSAERRRRERSAAVQWMALGLIVALVLLAALFLGDGGPGNGVTHTGLPEIVPA